VDNHVQGQGATATYTERLLTIPSIGDNGQADNVFKARFFQSTAPGPRPLVIVLPIWAGSTYPSRKITSFLQRRSDGSVHVLHVLGEESPINLTGIAAEQNGEAFLDLFRLGVERHRVTVMDIRRLVDWAEQRPEIDGSRVALVGFSAGAIVGGVVATQEPRLTATVLVMGAAHPHQVIAHCAGKKTTAIQERAETFGWDQDELEQRLEPLFQLVDSSNYPGKVDPESVLIFEAGRDGCMPEEAREGLWEAMGRPQRITMSYGHRTSFLSMTPLGGKWLCHQAWRFLQERLFADDEAS